MDRRAVAEAVARAGLELPADLDFEVTGDEPVLASPHRLATGAAAARLLTGVAANELWRSRTGRTQSLCVDAGHAAASLTSFAHVSFLDPDRQPRLQPRSERVRVLGIFATGDGRHVQLHGSFNDGPQVLEELGLASDAGAEEIAAAVGRRGAFELEAAFIRRRICGGVVMTADEWASHPQGRAVAGWPVVRITRIGDAPRRPLPDGDRPASGVRVLDLTRVLAGPTCARTVAEHGADVLHVTAPHLAGTGVFDIDTGFGKRQCSVDLDTREGVDAMRDLLAGADVFSQGYRLGTLERRGFGPAQVAELSPGIVYVSENCYGPVGPWSGRPGWEQLAQAATGMSHREGAATPEGTPRLAPAAVNDYSTGFLAAYGAMMALARRATEGGSWHVQVSLCQTSTWYQSLGTVDDPETAVRPDPTPYLSVMDTPHYGPVRHLAPALAMSQTPPRWELPPVPDGTHEAVWLPR